MNSQDKNSSLEIALDMWGAKLLDSTEDCSVFPCTIFIRDLADTVTDV